MSYKMEGRKSDDTHQSVIALFREFATLFEWGPFTLRPACHAKGLQSETERAEPLPKPAEWRSKQKFLSNFWTRAAQNNWFLYLYLYVSESRKSVG